MNSKLFLLAFGAVSLFLGSSANAQTYAITNAKIVAVSGATMDKGTVVIRNGLIVGAVAIIPVLLVALPDPAIMRLAVMNTMATILSLHRSCTIHCGVRDGGSGPS